MLRLFIILIAIIAVAAGVTLFAPSRKALPNANQQQPTLVATIHPVAAILREIVGDQIQVKTLLSPAASPHTFDPKPSDVATAEQALAVFFVDPALDGWAAKLGKQRVSLFAMVPEELRLHYDPQSAHVCAGHDHAHDHDVAGHSEAEHDEDEHAGSPDPHFWTDPLVVKAILPALVEALGKVAPEHAATFASNADQFATQLDSLNAELSHELAADADKPVFLFHPSLLYFLHRYGLEYGGAVEPFAGNSPGPQYLETLIRRLNDAKTTAIFTEPQLASQSARVIAREVGDFPLKVYVLDPIGGIKGRETYADLLRYNARTLVEAFD